MKKIFILTAAAIMAAACNLDLTPITSYNEANVKLNEEEEGESASQYTTREDMAGLRNSIYDSWIKDIQEMGLEDWLVYSETRADNAYCGTATPEIMALEANKQDGSNKNITRDWNWYQQQVSNANQIICNIDRIAEADPALSTAERDQWKAEAMIWRAFCFFRLTLLWGDAPMVLSIPPALTAANVEEVYPLYFPDRVPLEQVYTKLVEDLTWAADYAPDVDPSNKTLMSKALAKGLLARVYAENTPFRDWTKVAQYCTEVEGMGFSLEPNYADLWGYEPGEAGDAKRNSVESIFEVQWVNKSQGNWVFMMYHRNAYNPDDSYTWAKWTTPSRDLIQAYQDEGDEIRMNASIIWDSCGWSNYYDSDNYAFMHKMPTNVSSILVMRLAEIYLLHAEALACNGDLDGAKNYVNKVRQRVNLPDIPTPASQDAAIDAILKERRLELAFEGFRFFDLVRHSTPENDRVKKVHDSMNTSGDKFWQTRIPMDPTHYLLPVPTEALNNNPNLQPNPGY